MKSGDTGRIDPGKSIVVIEDDNILREVIRELLKESGYKVVLTGEGSDEILAGYDIFKETKILCE